MQTDERTDAIFEQFARITSALGAPSRLKLLDRLCQGEQTVEQLADAAGLSISNASRQLRTLAGAGLVTMRREPPYVYYRVADVAVERFWFALRDLASQRLTEFDRLVEAILGGEDRFPPMTREELIEHMAQGDVVLVDVRPEAEYRAGHIDGALSVPLESLPGRLKELPRARRIVAYCRGPYCMLAVDAVASLQEHGFDAVRLEEGLPEWRAAGLPIAAGVSPG